MSKVYELSPQRQSLKEISTYRGMRIFARQVIPPKEALPQTVYMVIEWVGIWNSEQALKDYIDFRLSR